MSGPSPAALPEHLPSSLGQVDFQAVLEPGSTLPRLLVPCASCLSPWHLILSLCCPSLVSSFYQTASPTGVLPGRHVGTFGRATRRANQQAPDPVPSGLQGLPSPPALQEEKGAALGTPQPKWQSTCGRACRIHAREAKQLSSSEKEVGTSPEHRAWARVGSVLECQAVWACAPARVLCCGSVGEAGPRQRWALVHGLLYED